MQLRPLFAALVIGAAVLGGACILGPKQDDPTSDSVGPDDTGVAGADGSSGDTAHPAADAASDTRPKNDSSPPGDTSPMGDSTPLDAAPDAPTTDAEDAVPGDTVDDGSDGGAPADGGAE